jgi:hypothetical protein
MTDSKEDHTISDDAQLLTFKIIEERLRETVQREEEIDYKSAKDNLRTQQIGRGALLVVLALTPPVFYLIWSLVLSMGIITDRMQAMRDDVSGMRTNFDEVSVRVAQIDDSVGNMSGNISVLPPMEERVAGMRRDYDQITGAMGTISPNVSTIDNTLFVMDQNMARMNYFFGFINRDVFRMQRNVNQMSSPMRMIPFIGQ